MKRIILHVANSFTKFEDYCPSKDISGGVKFKNVSRDPDLTSAGWDLLPLNLPTNIEVSVYSHYEDMRSGAKCTNWGSLGHLGVTQGHRQYHHSIKRIRLSI